MQHISDNFTYLIGIDSGGTKSELMVWRKADLAPENQVSDEQLVAQAVATVRHDGMNLDGISDQEATSRLLFMLEEAARTLEMSVSELAKQSFLVLGMAGLDTDLDTDNAERWITQSLTQHDLNLSYALISDVELGLWAGTRTGQGIVLIAGTGSNCFGRNSQGEIRKAGGLSHFFSDEGGGFMLGWEALHFVGKMFDGREAKTPLYEIVLDELGVSS
ncbi:hypothetical protein LRY58_01310, partial [Candidatus Woesebacteria bacterium]|nr:hypothetical protein [Candidatus Woesebacteria bacterium]